jgi:hypothetical protein
MKHAREDGKCIRNITRKPEGKRPFGIHRCRWDDNIRVVIKEIGCEVVDWIYQAQDRDRREDIVCTVIKIRVP